MLYNASFTYTEPRFGDIDLEVPVGTTLEEANEIALEQISASYPEALDVEIIGLKEIN